MKSKISDSFKLIAVRLSVYVNKVIYSFFKTFTKIDNNLIIFEGTMGRFDESSWVLYHYLREKKKYRFIWMVKRPEKMPKYEDTLFFNRYRFPNSIVADYYYAKAGYSFYTHTTSATKYKRPGQKKIFFGHGYAIKARKGNGRDDYNNFDFGLATGDGAINTQALFVGCEPHELLPLGLPRNDLLFRNNGTGKDNPLVKDLSFKKLILWMPTFRDSRINHLSESSCSTDTGLPLLDTEDKVVRLNSMLSQYDCVILLKIHRLQMKKAIFNKKFSNIIIITDKDIDAIQRQLYEVIGYSDALLTDYSSVSVDYLLLDKPIGYILNDMDYYKKDRGFTSDNPLDVMAGNYIYTEDDLYEFISDVLKGKDDSKEKRHLLIKKLHNAPEGNSCDLISKEFNL